MSIESTANVVATSSLSAVGAKNYAPGSNALLTATLGANGAAGQLVANTTHPSVGWTYKSRGGNNFSMTQPLVGLSAPPAIQSTLPPRVDAWSNGDAVSLMAPVAVNLIRFEPRIADWNASRSNAAVLYRVTVLDPRGAGADNVYLGANVLALESQFQRTVILSPDASGAAFAVIGNGSGAFGFPSFINCQFLGGFAALGSFSIWGGSSQNYGLTSSSGNEESIIDADFILGGGAFVTQGTLSIGTIYLDSNATFGGNTTIRAIDTGKGYSDQIWYGNSNAVIQLAGRAHLENHDQTFAQAFTLTSLLAPPGFKMNQGNLPTSTACSHTNGSPDVRFCGLVPIVANLDAPAGDAGFGGHAETFAGASISAEP